MKSLNFEREVTSANTQNVHTFNIHEYKQRKYKIFAIKIAQQHAEKMSTESSLNLFYCFK
jgi:hypothetical protein